MNGLSKDLGILIIAGLLSACASSHKGDEAIFRESAATVAPVMPVDVNSVDERHLQSQADYHFALGDAHALEGQVDQAIEELKLALVYDNKSSTIRLRLAGEFVKKGMVTEALEQAELASQHDPKSVGAHSLLGGLYSAIKAYDKAMVSYQKVIELDPDAIEPKLLIGALLAEQKKWSQAVQHLEKLAKDPTNKDAHFAWYYLGRVHRESKLPNSEAKAEAAFRQSIKTKPSFSEGTLVLSDILVQKNNRKEAAQILKNYQSQHGPHSAVANMLGRLAMEDEDYDLALDQFAILESSDPDNLNIKVKMALIYIEQKRYPPAVDKLKEILAVSPDSDKIRFYLAAVYEELKEYERAITQFNKIPVTSTFYNEAIIHAAYLHKLMRRYDDAIQLVEKAIEYRDNVPQFYVLQASFYDDTKQYQKAIGLLTKGVQKITGNAQMHFFLGSMHDRMDNREELIKHMKPVLEIEPEHVHALNYLAYTFAEMGKHLDEAEVHAKRALEQMPDDGYILDTYGWVMFKKGDISLATQSIERAMKLQPNEAIIAEHLGDVYFAQHLAEKARRMYQLALEKESNAKIQQKLREKISALGTQTSPVRSVGRPQQPKDGERKPASGNQGNSCVERADDPDCL
jgi:tetratricopeptide (TPR) repeat protein